MACTMTWYVDGGCRRNGCFNAIGAAAANDNLDTVTMDLPTGPHVPTPTSARAELSAIKLALETALDDYDRLVNPTPIDLTIYADSKYAVDCMTHWIPTWLENGWRLHNGKTVKNQDLLRELISLHNMVCNRGSLSYIWIPRRQNRIADAACQRALDRQDERNGVAESSRYHGPEPGRRW